MVMAQNDSTGISLLYITTPESETGKYYHVKGVEGILWNFWPIDVPRRTVLVLYLAAEYLVVESVWGRSYASNKLVRRTNS